MSPKVLDGDPGPWDHRRTRVCARGRCTEAVIATRRMPHASWGPYRMFAQTRSRLGRRLAWLVVLGLMATALIVPTAAPVLAALSPDSDPRISTTMARPTRSDVRRSRWLLRRQPDLARTEKIDGSSDQRDLRRDHDSLAPVGQTFSWSSTVPSTRVLVKAGSDNHALYVYAPTAGSAESSGDTNLTHGPSQQGISHISFCYDTSNRDTDTDARRHADTRRDPDARRDTRRPSSPRRQSSRRRRPV